MSHTLDITDSAATLRGDDLIAVLAHDIRSPLETILLSCDLIGTRAAHGATSPGSQLDIIRYTVAQIERLVHDVMTMRAPDAPAAARVRDVVGETLADHHALAGAYGVTLSAKPVRADCCAAIGRAALLRVLDNLINNAIRSTPAGGAVRVEVEPLGGMIAFMVHDTGSGMADTRLRRLARDRSGLDPDRLATGGLGLAIVKAIVHAHGGSVRVDSNVGRGSTFTFLLPAAPPAHREGGGPDT